MGKSTWRAKHTRDGECAAFNRVDREELVMSMASPRTRRIFKELAQESVQVIQQALDSLERGGDTTTARSKLREIARKLTEIEWEYKACGW
jgi:hypothetical protein